MKSPLTNTSPAVVLAALGCFALTACHQSHANDKGHEQQGHHGHNTIVLTTPASKTVVLTEPYVCQIRSQRNIEVCALQDGYLEEVLVKEGQAVRQGDVMFKILPTLYQARLAAERAEAQLTQIEYLNTKKLYESTPPVVSIQEVALAQAKLDKANARVKLAEAEVDFTVVRAPFDGIVDRLLKQKGSLIEKKDVLTTLSDNDTVWVYFNVPETRYLEYKALQGKGGGGPQQLKLADSRVELQLANGGTFPHTAADVLTIEGKFNNETGNIAFRADFPNPEGLLRHGQTGTLLIHRSVRGAIVIPQRATFEFLDKRYVYVVGEDQTVHQRLITVAAEQDDIFVIKSGLGVQDRIVLDGVKQVSEGQKLAEFESRKPDEVLKNQKFPAE